MIYTTDSQLLEQASIKVRSLDVKTIAIKIDCRAGYKFFVDNVDNILVEARHSSDVAWTNIESGFIDLTPWAGNFENFVIRITADTVLDHEVQLARFHVKP